MKKNNKNKTRYFALGGLGEVGKNLYVIEDGNEIIILDSGTIFPEEISLGIDYIMADITYLKEHEKNIRALIITHGHEDHIGGIPYLLSNLNVPEIYAPNQAKELIEVKLKDHNINYKNLKRYDHNTKLKFKNMEVEFFNVTHSIPDSHGVAVTTSNGIIVSTGDFKLDLTPIGPKNDFDKMVDLGKRGVSLLLSDSTNALQRGYSMSESVVDSSLNDLFEENKNRRIIIATFASNIYRLKHIVETCYRHNKKIFVFGRSMENNIKISLEGNYINHPEIFGNIGEINKYDPKDIVILCTGTQGEPLAALSRIAKGTHKQIKLIPDDVIIFSSSAIPGNTKAIARTINRLFLQGVKVITRDDVKVHTSGHGYQDELKLMISLIKPKNFAPIHGEYRMLQKHAELANECGVRKENTFIVKNGQTLELENGKVKLGEKVSTGELYIDDSRLKDINGAVLRDRKIMANDGILLVIANISMDKKKLLINPNITTRGFVLINESEDIITSIENIASNSIESKLKEKNISFNDIKNKLISDLYPFVNKLTGRKPVIVPIIIDIKK